MNQVITAPLTINALNTVLLDTALLIDVTQELWIGIRCNTTAGYPLGASNNGVVTNKGELIRFGNTSLTWPVPFSLSQLLVWGWRPFLTLGHLRPITMEVRQAIRGLIAGAVSPIARQLTILMFR